MAGAITTEGRGARRALDFELNMVPMIDLLMVTISFLLLTAVWSRLSRIESDAMVPGSTGPAPPATECAGGKTCPAFRVVFASR